MTRGRHFGTPARRDVDVWAISWGDAMTRASTTTTCRAGAAAVVEAEVIEERLVLGGPPRVRHRAGEAFDFDASHVHRCARTATAPAVSIHAYSPPLWRMGSYAVGADGTLRRESVSYAEELRPSRHGERDQRSGRHRRRRDGPVHRLPRGARHGARVVVLERGRVGDPATASYGRTRSFRNDYLDADVRAPRPRGDPPVGRLRARDRRAGARALRLHEHRQGAR